MAPCPDAEVTAVVPQNLVLSTWTGGSAVTEIIRKEKLVFTNFERHELQWVY